MDRIAEILQNHIRSTEELLPLVEEGKVSCQFTAEQMREHIENWKQALARHESP